MANDVDLGKVTGAKGEKGDKGDTLFSLEMDEQGNIYAVYADGATPPQFELEADGKLYLVVPD